MSVAEELRKDADLAIKEGGMYYSGEYLDAIARRAESEQAENTKLRDDLEFANNEWEKDSLEYLNLQAENAKLRELCSALYEFAYDEYPDSAELNFADRMRELGVEVENGD